LADRSHIILALSLISVLCSLLVPFLPVTQTTASLDWGGHGWKNEGSNDVTAPLVALVPEELHASIPCSAVATLPPSGGVLLSTAPKNGEGALGRALFVQAFPDQIQITSHGRPVASAPRSAVAGSSCQQIVVWADKTGVGARFEGLDPDPGTVLSPYYRPEFSGVFTDLKGDQPAPPTLSATIDTRFQVEPTLVKTLAVLLAVLTLAGAFFFALRRPVPTIQTDEIQVGGRRRARRADNARDRRLRVGPLDAVVAGVLLIWNWLGAYSADDGYLIGMGRAAVSSGYLANYYRYYGAAEAPFDWYDRVLSAATRITDQDVWLRLISVAVGLATWWLITRIALPRLGPVIAGHRLARASAAATLLAFWLPLDSGLRPEGLIVFGSLATWCLAERAVATRSLPLAAAAVTAAALTQAIAPQGIIAVAALIATSRPLIDTLRRLCQHAGGGGRKREGRTFLAAAISLIAAAGLIVLPVVFGQQTARSVLEAARLRYAVDLTFTWDKEFVRWDFILEHTYSGSLARRWPVFAMLLCLGVVVFALSRRRLRGVRHGSAWRLVAATFLTMLLLSLVPYKWIEHFGVYAGFAACLAAAATALAAEYAKRSPFVTPLVFGATLAVAALSTSGNNGWFPGQSWSVPWFDRRPLVAGHEINSFLLVGALACGAVAAWQFLRRDYRGGPDARRRSGLRGLGTAVSAPVLTVSAAMVVFELLCFVKAGATRYPAYSLPLGDFQTAAGSCGLADSVLVEADPNAGMLRPVGGDVANGLNGPGTSGFSPKKLPDESEANGDGVKPGAIHINDLGGDYIPVDGQYPGTGGGFGPVGVNGSNTALPFGLDPAQTPVMGSYGSNNQEATLTSNWYELGQLTGDTPILVLSAAGSIFSVDETGKAIYGQNIQLEFGRWAADGSIAPTGRTDLDDPGINRAWRNLRIPVTAIPPGSTLVRIQADDHDLQPDQWLAVTPPRLPHLVSLQTAVGSKTPVLLDFSIAAQFPCQRPLEIHDGLAEIPDYRITPDRVTAVTVSKTWMADTGGGLLGIIDALVDPTTVPTYLDDDWKRDWGSLQRYALLAKDAKPAIITTSVVTRSGWWKPGPSQILEPRS
jgi:hypothetical protein